jgi:hypothetical protein
MTMYFSAKRKESLGGGNAIGLATSSDDGASWRVPPPNQAPIVAKSGTEIPYMPSVIQIDGGYLLACAWVCEEFGLYQESTIKVAFSSNGVSGWVTRGSVPTGSCNENTFDDGSANRPRLVLDPNNQTIHMFYSAYEWDHISLKPTRDCGRIGYAVSNDDGFTWTKPTSPALVISPVFEPRMSPFYPPGAWDWNSVLKPSLVVEPCGQGEQKLRLFYEGGAGQGNPVGLGIADAPWPFTASLCVPGTMIAMQEEPAPDDEGSIARLTSVPNPTSGTTTIEVDFSRAQVAGEAELTIIDVTGRLVRQLWTGSSLTAPRSIDWDGRESSGARVAPGKYLARMRLGDATAGSHWITMTR